MSTFPITNHIKHNKNWAVLCSNLSRREADLMIGVIKELYDCEVELHLDLQDQTFFLAFNTPDFWEPKSVRDFVEFCLTVKQTIRYTLTH